MVHTHALVYRGMIDLSVAVGSGFGNKQVGPGGVRIASERKIAVDPTARNVQIRALVLGDFSTTPCSRRVTASTKLTAARMAMKAIKKSRCVQAQRHS